MQELAVPWKLIKSLIQPGSQLLAFPGLSSTNTPANRLPIISGVIVSAHNVLADIGTAHSPSPLTSLLPCHLTGVPPDFSIKKSTSIHAPTLLSPSFIELRGGTTQYLFVYLLLRPPLCAQTVPDWRACGAGDWDGAGTFTTQYLQQHKG